MRTLVGIVLVAVVGCIAAALWGLAYFKGDARALWAAVSMGEIPAPDFELPSTGAGWNPADLMPSPTPRPEAGAGDALAASFGRAGLIGEGEAANGLQVLRARAGEGAVRLADGQAIGITAPDGYRLLPGFLPADGGGAAALMLAEAPDGVPIMLMLHGADDLRRANLNDKLRHYETLAKELSRTGRLGGDGRLTVRDVSHDARGVIFCLVDRSNGQRMLTGMRLNLGITVIATIDLGCGEFDEGAEGRLAAAVGAVGPAR